jgi:hypothetical protein
VNWTFGEGGGEMRRLMVSLLAGAALVLPATAASASGGLSPKQLSDAGWTCFNVVSPVVGTLGVHCAPPGQSLPPTGQPYIQLLYFFHTTDPSSDEPDFSGTESLIRADLYRGQPCPTEPGPGGGYTYLPDIGLQLDYYACHRQTP